MAHANSFLKPWIDLAKADKRRYEEEMASYTPPVPRPAKKRPKDPHAPKGVRTGFQFLLDSKRAEMQRENQHMPYNVLSQEVGRIWRAMTDVEKSPWMELARNDRIRYDAEMANYKPPRYIESGNFDKGEKLKDLMRRDPNAPKQPKGAYVFYASAKREELQATHPDLSFPEVMKQVGASWKGLSLDERKVRF